MQTAVGEFCRDMWKSPDSGRLLVIFGVNGTGKTRCAKAVHRWVMTVGHAKQFIKHQNEISHLQSLYWEWSDLLDSLKNGQWDLVPDCIMYPCLIIDELGGGHDPSSVGVDKLCQILSRREHKWTMITTNVPPAEWKTKFDYRVASRLLRNSTIIDLTGVPDFNEV